MELLCRLALLLTAVGVSSPDKLPAGGCVDGGRTVSEGSLVPQPDPCHVCHCHRGRIECFWKSCAPPPRLCEVMHLEDRCNPSLYVCPIPASIADAPIHSASSRLTETRQPAPETPPPAPETPPPQVAAPARGRGRSGSRFTTSRLRSSGLRSPNSASVPAATKPARIPSRRRRPTAPSSQSRQTVTRTQVRAPQSVPRTQVTPSQTVTRSRVRSRRPTRRREQPRPSMKIRLGPPVLPLFQPADNFIPPPADLADAADSAVAASVLSGSTYFNEELSVPQNFTMPQGRGEAAPRSPQELLSAAEARKPFRFGPSRPRESSELKTEVAEASEAQVVTESPEVSTTEKATTEAPTTPAPRPSGVGRGFRRAGRRRNSRRLLPSSSTQTQSRTPSRRVVSPPRGLPPRRSRLATRRQQAAASRTVATTEVPTSTAAPTVPPATTAAPAPNPVAPVAPEAPSSRPPSRRAHSRARGRLGHSAVPVMTFDYDLDEDINPSDFTFPDFGRRLRREVPREEVFDAEAVRRLEEQWSARQHRRRRALLPGDENHVHDHGAEPTKSCSILGVKYELGEVIGVASDNCLECRCAAQAMFCSPKCCFFALEERLLREGRRSSPDQEPPRPHPLQAYIIE